MVALSRGITPQEYLEQERKAEFKSEYVNGRIYAMSGTSSAQHSIYLSIGARVAYSVQSPPLRSFHGDICAFKVSETRNDTPTRM